MVPSDPCAIYHRSRQCRPPIVVRGLGSRPALARSSSSTLKDRPGSASTLRGRTPGGPRMPAPEYSRGARVRSRAFRRTQRLRQFGYASYDAYLRSSAWATVKRLYRASDLPQDCVICAAAEVEMHHKTYERAGEELLADLMPLCSDCHRMLHELEYNGHVGLDFSGVFDEEKSKAGRAYLDDLTVKREQERADDAAARRAELDALPFSARIARAKIAARHRHVDISQALIRLRSDIIRGRHDEKLRKSVEHLERRAYGKAA